MTETTTTATTETNNNDTDEMESTEAASRDELSPEMQRAIEEIPELLTSDCALAYKLQLIQHLLGMTGTKNGLNILCRSPQIMGVLKKSILDSETHPFVREEILKIVVNTTSKKQVTTDSGDAMSVLMHDDMFDWLFDVVLDKEAKLAGYACGLIANMSQTQRNCAVILENIRLSKATTFPKLAEAFAIESYNEHSKLHFLGNFLANMTQLVMPRRFLLDKERCVIERILPYMTYTESSVRRLAAIRIIRNCVFHETSYHEWLLSPDIDILPALLLPLTGPEEYTEKENDQLPVDLQYLPDDKKREPIIEGCELLIETLVQLCADAPARTLLKDSGAYFVLRELYNSDHLKQEPEAVAQLLRLIHLLIGEEPEGLGTSNLKEVDVPVEIAKQVEQGFREEVEDFRKQRDEEKQQEQQAEEGIR